MDIDFVNDDNMKIYYRMILHFSTILIVCTLLGYLSHDLMKGIYVGILAGIGFALGEYFIKF
ncbi:hypothetical protein [Methanolobus sp. WCC5]|jgi:MFS superfamily sulfate permease-like transporter|uniref:hypothetical protein n=1 Tax=Methanolobus sp. WCC5 TaxID=3125785 RepID=UPI0032532DD6